jgi:SAM-dependent methyltransferase
VGLLVIFMNIKKSTIAKSIKLFFYRQNGRKPWSNGYEIYKEELIKKSIHDPLLIQKIQDREEFPQNYGEFIDERVVEYPWLIANIDPGEGRLLDAGSALNFDYLLKHPAIANKDISILTLEPEPKCYWQDRISYLFGDLRDIPIKDNWFDLVVSISTIEHVGLDNSIYSENPTFAEQKSKDFLTVISELKRITKIGGKVYITVPYGQYTNFGWYQQFNAEMIDSVISTFAPSKLKETYFCYESGGWKIGDKQYCGKFQGFNIHDTKYLNPKSTKDYDPDFAACSRAIAALELWK